MATTGARRTTSSAQSGLVDAKAIFDLRRRQRRKSGGQPILFDKFSLEAQGGGTFARASMEVYILGVEVEERTNSVRDIVDRQFPNTAD